MICGENFIVEIDESKFSKRKYNRRHRVEGQWVLGLVERTKERKMILIPVKKRDSVTLLQIIKKYVHPQSVIYTDKWREYNDLKNHFRDHKTANHSKYFKDPDTGVHTNTIEGNWSPLKKMLPNKWKNSKNIWLGLYMAMKKKK
ncbi:putative transposable element [Pseudoloma neurophilia]|uniref:Putative transposable element n=1 Tax=Pseudoloma neurophilia TaxID=146866 RepID=A0A0R0LXW0_9MICR|nr:putative transposable element [Pseudoloma neurophilia]